MTKLIAINGKAGFSILERGEDFALLVPPYTMESMVKIGDREKDMLLKQEGWFVFNNPRYFDSTDDVFQVMHSELSVNNIMRLMATERAANQGNIMRDAESVKVERILGRLRMISKIAEKDVDTMYDLSSLAFVYQRSKMQQDEIDDLRDLILNRAPETDVIPYWVAGLSSSINVRAIIHFIRTDMRFQKRYKIAQEVLKFLISNPSWLDGMDVEELKALYDEIREEAANKAGYSTHKSIKRNTGNTKHFVSKKKT